MSWLEIALVIGALAGVFCGGFLVAQRPSFWIGLGVALIKPLLPVLMRRMDPATEQAWRDCIRRGGEWDHVRKRCKR